MKKVLRIVLYILLVIVLAAVGLIAWLSIAEYKPAPVEPAAKMSVSSSELLDAEESLEILSWNIGYGGLGKDSDFFMDGGKEVQAADEETVKAYLDGISAYLAEEDPDLLMLQEVDRDSKRTYGIDESALLARGESAFAYNYSCPFVPYPMPPIGKVNSGLLTTTDFTIAEANRIALPCPFDWPVRAANLKRCLLVSYLPIEGSDKQLVLVNLHLEAYDDGEGKLAQTKMLLDFISSEYEKGNYVIAGGDFNQTFPGSMEKYPIVHDDYWVPGTLNGDELPEGWRYVYDVENPTCRLLNRPYDVTDTENNQHYVLDGFIVSPNVEVESVESVDLQFQFSDHNPVKLVVNLK